MIVAIYISDLNTMAILSFAPDMVPAERAPIDIPLGVPYWLVDLDFIYSLLNEGGVIPDDYLPSEAQLGRPADGYGQQA